MQTELYERFTMEFASPSHRNHEYLAQGLVEEALEVTDAEANGTRPELLDELGDVLWYVTTMAKREGSSLSELMLINYNKLERRALMGAKPTT